MIVKGNVEVGSVYEQRNVWLLTLAVSVHLTTILMIKLIKHGYFKAYQVLTSSHPCR